MLSFVYIGIYWNNHHHMLKLTDRVTGGILWANLNLLFWLSLFPFTMRWVDESDLSRTPVVVYGVDLLLAAVAYYVLQSTIIRSQGEESVVAAAIGNDLKGKASPVLYALGIASAWADLDLGRLLRPRRRHLAGPRPAARAGRARRDLTRSSACPDTPNYRSAG